jgi:agmatinase
LFTSTVLRVVSGAFLSLAPEGGDQLNLTNGESVALNTEEAGTIETFSVPRTLESGVQAVQRRFPHLQGGDVLAIVMGFVDSGIIRLHELEPSTAVGHRRAGMYGCPWAPLEEAVAGDSSRVVFVGMPYELGVTGRQGARGGPAYLRRCSRVALDYVEEDGLPAGWWDSLKERRVLEGVRFCDIGDVQCAGTRRNGEAFDRLYDIATTLFRARRLPVVVGGDHSISLPLITAAADTYPGLGVLHFDAHADIGSKEDMGEWRRNCTHGNFMSWVAANPEVASITQFGLRHLLPSAPFASPKVTRYPGRAFVGELDAIVARLPADRPYYLTFDVDCLDPAVIWQTGTPVPGGLEYREVQRALEALSTRLDIVGMDVVELSSAAGDADYREGTAIAYLLLEVLANVFQRRSTRPARLQEQVG